MLVIFKNIVSKMFRVLQNFNLFPYPHLWRVGNDEVHSDKCSIILSLVVLILVGGLFAQRLATVIKKESITATSQTLISDSPPPTTVRTQQHDTDTKPFMIAFHLFSANAQFNFSDPSFQISSYVDHIQGSLAQNRTDYNQTITLEPCTPQHFSSIRNIEEDFVVWGAANWHCLPINKTYVVQGSFALDGTYSSINMLFNCSGTCQTTLQTLNLNFYVLSSIVNPHNSTDPEQYFIQEVTIPVRKGVYLQYSYDLTQNIIKTDTSLFPWQRNVQTHSIKPQAFKDVLSKDNHTDSSTLFYFQRSARTITQTRSFMKLLDAVSYVGGMFQAILGLFFFVMIFGRILYQFKFAAKYFRSQLAKRFSFRSFIQLLGFKVLKRVKCEPDWSEARQRDEMQQTVNHLLDVVHLHKRIDFLQRAISILLQEHQLKGLHLIHDLTVNEAKHNFKQYQLRDNLISYLHDKERDIDYALQNQDYFKWSLFQKDYYKEFQSMLTGDMWKKNQKNSDQIGLQRDIQPNVSKMEMESRSPEKPVLLRRRRDKEKQEITRNNKNSVSIELQSLQMSKEILDPEDIPRIRQNIGTSRSLQDNFDMLRQSYAEIGQLDMQFNERDLRRELESNLQKLIDEADMPDGDIRSKKIFGSLDDWLKTMLKAVVKPKRRRVEERQMRKSRRNERDLV